MILVYIWLGALTFFSWMHGRHLRAIGRVLTIWARKYGRKWERE